MQSDIDMPCPVCAVGGGLKMISHVDDIPYFGEHTQVTLLCDDCGWRQTDFIPAEGRKPGAWSLLLSGKEQLTARVVRSSSCTIRIPELELEVSPGTAATGFVSNVEGVLKRFRDIVNMVIPDLEDEEDISRCNEILLTLDQLASGSHQGSVLLEFLDPRGHSQIIHPQAIDRDLSESELALLPMGPEPPVIESSDTCSAP